jgi:hypothetical protein
MLGNVVSRNDLSYWSTEELKNQVLELTKDRDTDALKDKVLFHKEILTPYFEELSKRNPYPVVKDQLPVVLGVWTPVWSTIPFHDTLPGRVHEQSYQIFHNNGYYANIARYAPGQNSGFLQKFSSFLAAYDFMVMQKFAVVNNQWFIQNVGIFQAFRKRDIPLTIDQAEDWFTSVLQSRLKENSQEIEISETLNLQNLDRNTIKKFEKTYLATPLLEHIYVDNDLRLVKTQRESKQRPSYTIAVRRR